MRLLSVLLFLSACIGPKRIERSDTQLNLGTAYYREGNLGSAVEQLNEATKSNPHNARAWNTLGIVYMAAEQPKLAERSFKHALRVDPTEAEILNNYGNFLIQQQRTDEAIKVLKKATEDLDYRRPALVYSNLAYAQLQAGQLDDAMASAITAIKRAPMLCEAYYQLGLIQEARQETDGALGTYARMMQVCPDDSAGARVRAGCLHVQSGIPEIGMALLEEIVQEQPNTGLASQARACMGPTQ